MLTDHLRRLVDQLAQLPPNEQEEYAAQLESEMQERERVAHQLADARETDLEALLEEARQQIARGEVSDLDDIL